MNKPKCPYCETSEFVVLNKRGKEVGTEVGTTALGPVGVLLGGAVGGMIGVFGAIFLGAKADIEI